MTDIAGWPHWEIQFDKAGNTDAAARAALIDQITMAELTDLIIMSHGWGASVDQARQCMASGSACSRRSCREDSRPGWGRLAILPALLWPDEPQPAASDTTAGGAAALPEATVDGTPGAPVAALGGVYGDPGQRQILSQLAALLDGQSPDEQALAQFHDQMRALAATEPQAISEEDSGPLVMLDQNPQTLAARFAAALDQATLQATTGLAAVGDGGQTFDEGGAADLPDITLADTGQAAAGGIGDITSRLWAGPRRPSGLLPTGRRNNAPVRSDSRASVPSSATSRPRRRTCTCT